jgi:uncharacterized protein (DUF849 family)
MLKAAINGIRKKSGHPNIPVSDTEILNEIKTSLKAGADAIHFHVRNKEGSESLFTDDLNRIFTLLRKELPDAKLGISSGEWILPDSQKRIEVIKGWEMLPNFVSVNIDEEAAEDVAGILISKKVGVEVGISFPTEAEKFVKSNFAKDCLRILIEPIEQDISDVEKNIREIESVLDKSKITIPRLLHGFDNVVWHLVKLSAEKGYSTRVGFEDTLTLPDGKITNSNAELVSEAIKILNK